MKVVHKIKYFQNIEFWFCWRSGLWNTCRMTQYIFILFTYALIYAPWRKQQLSQR